MAESRGNTNYVANGKQIGVYHFSSLMHFGPDGGNSAWESSLLERNEERALNLDYHLFQLVWAPSGWCLNCLHNMCAICIYNYSLYFTAHISFGMDNDWHGTIYTGDGFYSRGNFHGENPWVNGSLNAPFDQEFYFILHLAVGGKNGYFPDVGNEYGKAWRNDAPFAMRDFWTNRQQWFETWDFDTDSAQSSSLQVDYIRVYAL